MITMAPASLNIPPSKEVMALHLPTRKLMAKHLPIRKLMAKHLQLRNTEAITSLHPMNNTADTLPTHNKEIALTLLLTKVTTILLLLTTTTKPFRTASSHQATTISATTLPIHQTNKAHTERHRHRTKAMATPMLLQL